MKEVIEGSLFRYFSIIAFSLRIKSQRWYTQSCSQILLAGPVFFE